jgi:hypothetical protein
MSKLSAVLKPTNGGSEKGQIMVVKPSFTAFPTEKSEEVPVSEVKPDPEVIAKPEMTMQEKILKVENLQLIVEKRAKLVQTRSELERFQISSNDFNCSMRLNDSDGNVFTTSFTPGVKKVIDFLKASFDASIIEVEGKITF